MTDAEVRAELERISKRKSEEYEYAANPDTGNSGWADALRLLAQKHQALREIIEKYKDCGCCEVQELVAIAKTAIKEE